MASLPRDGNFVPMPLEPSGVALARTISSSISASTQITFNASTTFLRIYPTSQDVYLKWGTTAVTSSNFDEILPAGQVIDVIIPRQTEVITLYTACTIIERTPSASIVIVEK